MSVTRSRTTNRQPEASKKRPLHSMRWVIVAIVAYIFIHNLILFLNTRG